MFDEQLISTKTGGRTTTIVSKGIIGGGKDVRGVTLGEHACKGAEMCSGFVDLDCRWS